ncbi:hypothetical protein AAF712_010911 [Marasmius tenuissimus]|uniref:CxC1-like cysteine cluster associated with KDZ transposases domain-containing protein n=1 Tax=Marasmius tenuissimus TaxID=585030 RepID=A0ABR2ZMS3_9AGAR
MIPRRKISLGRLQISPKNKRAKANTSVVTLDFHAKRKEALRKQIAALKRAAPAPPSPSAFPSTPSSSQNHENDASMSSPSTTNIGHEEDSMILNTFPTAPTTPATPSKRDILSTAPSPAQIMLLPDYDILPNSSSSSAVKTPNPHRKVKQRVQRKVKTAAEEAEGIIQRWKTLLTTLEGPFLQYRERTVVKAPEEIEQTVHRCKGSCIVIDSEVHIYHIDHHRIRTFRSCSCQSLAQSLVLQGFFPTSPSQHRMAIAIDLLDLYQALCRHSSDAVTSLASALETTYRRRGFRLLDSTGNAPIDPLRRALGHSLEWYDMLGNTIDRHLDNCLEDTKAKLQQLPDTISSITSPHTTSSAFTIVSSHSGTTSANPATQAATQLDTSNQTATVTEGEAEEEQSLAAGQCSAYLQRLCPACFGGKQFGDSFRNGGDVHIALDGNFHHRHLKSGGDGAQIYDSYRFLEKECVDAVGVRVEEARKRPPKPRNPIVPDEVVDADSESYKAAKGDKDQTSSKRFDENGMTALVCRHDIPLLAVSIDTPGEQQKFAIAPLEDFFHQIPEHATVMIQGCRQGTRNPLHVLQPHRSDMQQMAQPSQPPLVTLQPTQLPLAALQPNQLQAVLQQNLEPQQLKEVLLYILGGTGAIGGGNASGPGTAQ